MRTILAPSILSADFGRMRECVQQLDAADSDWIHIDVMDGSFVPPITFGAEMVTAVRSATNKPLDVHLMINHPETQIEMFRDAGADRLTVHVEACPHVHRVLQSIRDAGMNAGVALNPGTAACAVPDLLSLVDLVLVMTVNPGWGGQSFIADCLTKVRYIRNSAPQHFVQVDGGIDPTTIGLAAAAGADVFVAGSYTFSGEPSERLKTLRSAVCEPFAS